MISASSSRTSLDRLRAIDWNEQYQSIIDEIYDSANLPVARVLEAYSNLSALQADFVHSATW